MSDRPKLSVALLRELPKGSAAWDHVVPGLHAYARAGVKSWYLAYRAKDGTRRKPRIGAWPAMPIENARAVARELLDRVALGQDPSGERQEARDAITMDALFSRWLTEYATANKKPRSIEEDERNWKHHVSPVVGKVKAAAFSLTDFSRVLKFAATIRPEVVALANPTKDGPTHRTINYGGPIAANRVRALVSGVLTFAEHSEVAIRPRGSNLTRETAKNPEYKRRRHLKPEEFPRVFSALAALADTHPQEVAAVLVMLYGGSRVSELLPARMSWLKGRTVVLLDHKTATTAASPDARRIILPDQALAILRKIPRDPADPDPLLFGAGLDRHDVSRAWARVRDAAGCPDVQARDLRRSFASVGRVAAGLDLDGIGDLLGHAGDAETTAGYAYLFEATKETKVQQIANAMDGYAKPASAAAWVKPTWRVRQLKRR